MRQPSDALSRALMSEAGRLVSKLLTVTFPFCVAGVVTILNDEALTLGVTIALYSYTAASLGSRAFGRPPLTTHCSRRLKPYAP